MEFHVIPWWNHVKFHGGITLDKKPRRWNHAMEFHAGCHGQNRAERIVHRPPWNGMELTTTRNAFARGRERTHRPPWRERHGRAAAAPALVASSPPGCLRRRWHQTRQPCEEREARAFFSGIRSAAIRNVHCLL